MNYGLVGQIRQYISQTKHIGPISTLLQGTLHHFCLNLNFTRKSSFSDNDVYYYLLRLDLERRRKKDKGWKLKSEMHVAENFCRSWHSAEYFFVSEREISWAESFLKVISPQQTPLCSHFPTASRSCTACIPAVLFYAKLDLIPERVFISFVFIVLSPTCCRSTCLVSLIELALFFTFLKYDNLRSFVCLCPAF